MKLELTIAGLCLLVDDDAENVVYVLLPADGHVQHGAYLIYPEGRAISPANVGRPGFNLTGLADAGANKPRIPAGILDMKTVCSKIGDLPRESLKTNSKKTAGWAQLRGGELSILSQQCCSVGGVEYFVASQVKWTIESDDLHTRLVALGLLSGASSSVASENAGVIEIGLVHVQPSAMTKITTLDDLHRLQDADFAHYSAFYSLFDSGCSAVPESCGAFGPKGLLKKSPSVCMVPYVKAAP